MKKLKIILPIIAMMSLTSCANVMDIFNSIINSDDSSTSQGSGDVSDYTVLVYISGSDLESDYGAATVDLQEMVSTSCPDNVNIVIQTGGSPRWGLCEYNQYTDDYDYVGNPFNIKSDAIGRYHIEGKSLVKKQELANASMGKAATLESFVTWGFNNYPAKQTGLILWNHGAAMGGCCFDDNYDDSLTAGEVNDAIKNAMSSLKREEKFTWIGYDCCLMSIADIASVNAQYFDYMVASQESEAGEGWAYDSWLPVLYNNPSITPKNLLPEICTSFIERYDEIYGDYYANDQTLSVLDLSKMDNFISAFEAYAKALNVASSSGFDKIKTAYNNSLRFGYDEDYGYLFGVADFKDFINKMQSQFSSVSNTELLEALNELVIHNSYGDSGYSSTKPCGLSVFVAYAKVRGGYGLQCSKSMYTNRDSLLTTWRSINYTYGFK